MAEREALTAAYVRSILHYDPETGEFRWKERTPDMFAPGRRPVEWSCKTWNSKNAGNVAGVDCGRRYLRIGISGRDYYAHRLAWLWITGEWPLGEIDHINLDKSDNRWSNLREATHSQNTMNRPRRIDNTSGCKGVVWDRSRNKWAARIKLPERNKHLGRFSDREDAARAYELAALEHFGEFARTE